MLERATSLTIDRLRFPLSKAAEQLWEWLEARNVEEKVPWGMVRCRVEPSPYSSDVDRPALLNAVESLDDDFPVDDLVLERGSDERLDLSSVGRQLRRHGINPEWTGNPR